ncbi:MAG: hypothetical protein Q4B84_00830 [Clostridia bacterium]|nr:hypothetical protein [Clostridia bacterium]
MKRKIFFKIKLHKISSYYDIYCENIALLQEIFTKSIDNKILNMYYIHENIIL